MEINAQTILFVRGKRTDNLTVKVVDLRKNTVKTPPSLCFESLF